MKRICENTSELVGSTPIVRLRKYCDVNHISQNLYVKLEANNPGGSIKARAAMAVIGQAEEQGIVGGENALIIDAVTVDEGMALAYVCAVKGYKFVAVMPKGQSKLLCSMMRAYGAKVVFSAQDEGLEGARRTVRDMLKHYPDAYCPSISSNEAAVNGMKEIAAEIWRDMDGQVDIVVTPVRTGATATAMGEYFKKKKRRVRIIAVQCQNENERRAAKPALLNTGVTDVLYPVSPSVGYGICVGLGATEGLFVGVDSGAAVYAAMQLARLPQNEDKNIAVILPDSGMYYVETGLFDYNDNYVVLER